MMSYQFLADEEFSLFSDNRYTQSSYQDINKEREGEGGVPTIRQTHTGSVCEKERKTV